MPGPNRPIGGGRSRRWRKFITPGWGARRSGGVVRKAQRWLNMARYGDDVEGWGSYIQYFDLVVNAATSTTGDDTPLASQKHLEASKDVFVKRVQFDYCWQIRWSDTSQSDELIFPVTFGIYKARKTLGGFNPTAGVSVDAKSPNLAYDRTDGHQFRLLHSQFLVVPDGLATNDLIATIKRDDTGPGFSGYMVDKRMNVRLQSGEALVLVVNSVDIVTEQRFAYNGRISVRG